MSKSSVTEYLIIFWGLSEFSGHSKGSWPVNVLWSGTVARLEGAEMVRHVLIGYTNQSKKKMTEQFISEQVQSGVPN